LPSYRLTALNPRSAVFEGPDGEHALDLRVFDGNGGQPPTAIQLPDETPEADANSARPASKPATRPATPARSTNSAPIPTSPPAVPSPAAPPPNDDSGPDTEAQIEGIRKRIEERRRQLRQQNQNPPAPAQNP
jgi:general secretion pathway protein N